MKAIELYKFIKDNDIEWRYQDNNGYEDVILFLPICHIKEFRKLFSTPHFDHGGIECRMVYSHFAFWMNDICEYYDIELNEIFDKKEGKN